MAQISRQPVAKLTLADFLARPETKPASEFVEGDVWQKPMPQGKHSAIQSELVPKINGELRGRKVARAFSELRCTFGNRSTVPDVSVFVWDRIACDSSGEIANVFPLVPDWIIEILSPDQSQTKVVKNIVYGLKHGALMGWLIDPGDRTVFVYYPSRELEILDEPEMALPVPTFAEGLLLTVGELFGWLAK
ncbi:Uma2 family endonuclease [Spirulina subsalsa]|uniref:Uma2 family endonuclease n=1 Tax=Spirulina subsalsa TaxID=54311 RepID=UPI00030D2578|nr:Uma2 family endonuclease [Spirulina subsalsa]